MYLCEFDHYIFTRIFIVTHNFKLTSRNLTLNWLWLPEIKVNQLHLVMLEQQSYCHNKHTAWVHSVNFNNANLHQTKVNLFSLKISRFNQTANDLIFNFSIRFCWIKFQLFWFDTRACTQNENEWRSAQRIEKSDPFSFNCGKIGGYAIVYVQTKILWYGRKINAIVWLSRYSGIIEIGIIDRYSFHGL